MPSVVETKRPLRRLQDQSLASQVSLGKLLEVTIDLGLVFVGVLHGAASDSVKQSPATGYDAEDQNLYEQNEPSQMLVDEELLYTQVRTMESLSVFRECEESGDRDLKRERIAGCHCPTTLGEGGQEGGQEARQKVS